MKVTIKNIIYISITTLFLLCGVSQAQQIKLGNLPKTCLPEAGRMMPDIGQVCHCPPQEMCTQTAIFNGQDIRKLPSFIYNICCEQAPTPNVTTPSGNNECDVHYFQTSLSTCPDETRITARTARFCGEYVTTNATETTGITALNTCLATNCKPTFTRMLSRGGTYNRGQNNSRGFQKMKEEIINQIDFKDYLACRNQCFSSQGQALLYTQNERDIARWTNLNLSNSRTDIEVRNSNKDTGGDVILQNSQLNAKLFYTWYFTTINQTNFGLLWNNTYAADTLGHPFRPLIQIGFQDRNIETDLTQSQMERKGDYRSFMVNNGFRNLDTVLSQPTPAFVAQPINASVSCLTYEDVNTCISSFSNNTSCLSCLSPDTQITMSDSDRKPIKDLIIGDKVMSAYGKSASIAKIIRKEWPQLVLYSINDRQLQLTADHPIMTKNGWRAVNYVKNDNEAYKRYGLNQVGTLKIGDFIQKGNDFVEVKSIVAQSAVKGGVTYNLQLDEPHNSFYANGILVKSHK